MKTPILATETLMDKVFKVLVIDDDAIDRMTVIRAFKGADFQTGILEAIDCITRIALAISHQFDCIFIFNCLKNTQYLLTAIFLEDRH